MLAGPGTPRDPESHLWKKKWNDDYDRLPHASERGEDDDDIINFQADARDGKQER